MTLKKFNENECKPRGLELVKGKGYFYWVTTNGNPSNIESVMVYAFCHADEKFWMMELKDALEQIEEQTLEYDFYMNTRRVKNAKTGEFVWIDKRTGKEV